MAKKKKHLGATPRRSKPAGSIAKPKRQASQTLRDYFAAKAMQACIARLPLGVEGNLSGCDHLGPFIVASTPELGMQVRRRLSELAYKYADSMLAERNK